MTDAELLFNSTFDRVLQRLGFVQTFRRVVLHGIPHGTEALANTTHNWLCDPANQRVFRDTPSPEGIRAMSTGAATRGAAQTRSALDRASLIFAHAIIDDGAYQYCRVSALASPSDWESDIEQRTVSLKDLRRRDVRDVVGDALEKRLAELEREPLMKKMDLLFAKCRPGEEIHTRAFRFQRSELERLDSLRHRTVHGDEFGKELPTIDNDLSFLSDVAIMMMVMINGRYGLKLDPEFMWRRE